MSSLPAPALTPEALALSASVFTSRIASWIPASFGDPSSSTRTGDDDLAAILRSMGGDERRSERLGLGHSSLAATAALGASKRVSATASGSLITLEKRLAQKGKGKEREEVNPEGLKRDKDDGDEEESRATLGKGKGKRNAPVDAFRAAGAKAKRQRQRQHHEPDAVLNSVAMPEDNAATPPENIKSAHAETVPDQDDQPQRGGTGADADVDGETKGDAPAKATPVDAGTGALSKSQKKRLRRKQKSLAEKDGETEPH